MFNFNLNQNVTINISGEKGKVISRLESVNSSNQYQVAYKAADGRAVLDWFFESDLNAE